MFLVFDLNLLNRFQVRNYEEFENGGNIVNWIESGRIVVLHEAGKEFRGIARRMERILRLLFVIDEGGQKKVDRIALWNSSQREERCWRLLTFRDRYNKSRSKYNNSSKQS